MNLELTHALQIGFMQLKAVVHQVITMGALEIYVMPPGQLSLEEALVGQGVTRGTKAVAVEAEALEDIQQ